MRTLLIDNYDSYTFNLFHLLGEVNGEEPIVVRNDELSWDELVGLAPDNVVISPGPGRPERGRDAGVSLEVLRRAEVPVLGVCLGHQALAYASGGTIEHAREVMHGRLSPIHHDARTLFAGIPQDFLAVRYHSLVVGTVPAELRVTAWTPGRRDHGARASRPPVVRRAVPSRVGEHEARPRAARELPRPHASPPPRRHAGGRPGASQSGTHRARTSSCAAGASRRGASPRPSSPRCTPTTPTRSGSTARAPVRASRGSPTSARRTGRWARSSPTTSARDGHVERASGRESAESVFDYCRRELDRLRVDAPELPFDFIGGFAGYFGFELKAECGGRAAAHLAAARCRPAPVRPGDRLRPP